MDQFVFAMIAMFGVPFGTFGLLVIAHPLVPKSIWYSFTAQTVITGLFLAALATPFLAAVYDSQGDYFEDEGELVRGAFALPVGASVDRQRDRTLRLGDCWRNAVNWRSQVTFRSDEEFDRWYADEGWRVSLVDQIADYFGVDAAQIAVSEGALDLRAYDPKYEVVDHHSAYSQNVKIVEFYEPFVCTAIERDGDGRLSLRACDPVALTTDTGNAGRVIINPSAKKRTLEGRIYYAQGPATCTNPLRRKVNAALGLPHPEGGEPNTQIGDILPSL